MKGDVWRMAVAGLALALAALSCVPGAPTAPAAVQTATEPTGEAAPTVAADRVELQGTLEFITLVPASTRTPEPGKATDAPDDTAQPEDTEVPEPVAGDTLFAPGDRCGWSTFAIDFQAFEYTDNYTFDVDAEQQYLEVPGKNVAAYAVCEDFADYGEVEIDVATSTVAGPNTNNVSLVCRYSEDGWYEGAITNGGYWYLYKFTLQAGYVELATGGSFAINLKRATNQLRMACVGETVTLYVNDTELGSVVDGEFSAGGFGISVSTFDIGGAGVLFDGLEVRVAE